MTKTRRDAINDALDRLRDIGFIMEPGFSEHGPMVAETISSLGCNDEVVGWLEFYKAKRRHIPPPPPKERLDIDDEQQWRAALGVYERVTDWQNAFRNDFGERPWQETLVTWMPRLIDGYAGSLTHGLIRTAHAVRALPMGEVPTPIELDELARGLASWAATYQRVAGNPDRHGDRSLDESIRMIPRAGGGRGRPAATADRPAMAQRSVLLEDLPGFVDAVEGMRPAPDIDEAISRHSAVFARILLAHPEIRPIPLIQLVHTITAPVAMRNLLPYVAADRGAWVYARLWQVSASIVARIVGPSGAQDEIAQAIAAPRLAREDLVKRAVEHRDEHAIKLTEALMRADNICPDPVYRVAAEAVLERLPPLT
jgi:hypothetical protein